jgi:hypothetical protein
MKIDTHYQTLDGFWGDPNPRVELPCFCADTDAGARVAAADREFRPRGAAELSFVVTSTSSSPRRMYLAVRSRSAVPMNQSTDSQHQPGRGNVVL